MKGGGLVDEVGVVMRDLETPFAAVGYPGTLRVCHYARVSQILVLQPPSAEGPRAHRHKFAAFPTRNYHL